MVMRSPDALRRIITAPGELGIARAYVAGDLDIDGASGRCSTCATAWRTCGSRPGRCCGWCPSWAGGARCGRLAPPNEEARLHGRRHSQARDAAAISHHYDVSNAFYRLVLGPSLTYSCAVFHDAGDTLEQARPTSTS